MENNLDAKFTRRGFLEATAKILAAGAVFSIAPSLAYAATEDKVKPVKFKMPKIKKFVPLHELPIGKINLEFTSDMDVRETTTAIVVHHAGMTRDEDLDVPTIHDMHLGNGWAGIGYHFVVHKDGFIEHGRPIYYAGAHAYQHNKYTVGICMTGNFEIGVPTQEQALATEQLVAALCKRYRIKPSRQTILGHRDLNDTLCPGENFYVHMPELVRNVKRAIS